MDNHFQASVERYYIHTNTIRNLCRKQHQKKTAKEDLINMKSIVGFHLWLLLALFSKEEQDIFLFAPEIIQCRKANLLGFLNWAFQ